MNLRRYFARHRLIMGNALEREFLVTGCGSSGTTYIGDLLYQNGIAISHDAGLGPRGIVTNACDGKEVWIYAYNRRGIKGYVLMKMPVTEFGTVVHVVRHPLKVIGSVLAKWRKWGGLWPHVAAALPDLDASDPCSLRNGCRYWLQWNRQLEPVAACRLRFEDIVRDPAVLFASMGLPRGRKSIERKVGDSMTTWYPTWKEIAGVDAELALALRHKAAEYGYDS